MTWHWLSWQQKNIFDRWIGRGTLSSSNIWLYHIHNEAVDTKLSPGPEQYHLHVQHGTKRGRNGHWKMTWYGITLPSIRWINSLDSEHIFLDQVLLFFILHLPADGNPEPEKSHIRTQVCSSYNITSRKISISISQEQQGGEAVTSWALLLSLQMKAIIRTYLTGPVFVPNNKV